MKKYILIILSILITVGLVLFLVSNSHVEKYHEVELLTDRLTDEPQLLHELIREGERLARYDHNLDSDLYNKNEGWLLRNKTTYCANRIISSMEKLSADTGIYQYQIGGEITTNVNKFKNHLESLNELCVNIETDLSGNRSFEAALFIDPNHKIWSE